MPPTLLGLLMMVLLPALGLAEPTAVELEPLSVEERAALQAVRADPPPAALSRGLHFIISDEKRHDHFRSAIQDAGGVYLGVGTDQNYTLAGWARPELMVLFDFDQLVVDLHQLYRLVFLAAETPEEFRRLWSFREARRLRALVQESFARPQERVGPLQALAHVRATVAKNLDDLEARYRQLEVPFFMSDPAQYAHLRRLFQQGRVLLVRGDLTAGRTLADLAAVLRRQARVVRVLYLSNAEQYFPYDRQVRANLLGLPYDARSWILRTRPFGFEYNYLVQRPENLRAWLEDRRTANVRHMAPRKLLSRTRPFSEIQHLPPPPPAPRTARGRGGKTKP
jgi:hypothetical protein